MKKFEDPVKRAADGLVAGWNTPDDRPARTEIQSAGQEHGPVGAIAFVLWRYLRYPLAGVAAFAVYHWLRNG